MNNFEFKKIMEYFTLNKNENDCYLIGELKLYYDGRGFAIVEGKTPFELAKIINNKYDNSVYKIRVNGNNDLETPYSNVYTYHIDTIEGLAAFLLETKIYYSDSPSTFEELDEILNSIYLNILKSVDTQTSIYNWMLEQNNRKEYFKTILSTETYLDFKLRKKIEQFDKVMNPFCDLNLNTYSNNFIVYGCEGKENNWFSLTDKDSKIAMLTIKKDGGFVLKLHIPYEEPYEFNIYHYFENNKEEIAFEEYNESDLTRLEYNITDKSFGKMYGEKHRATINDKNFIIDKLNEYIALVEEIIKKNITTISEENQALEKKLSSKK